MTQHLYNGVLFSKIMLFSDMGKRILPKNIFRFLSPTVLQTMAITKRVARERETFFQCLSRWRADTTGGGGSKELLSLEFDSGAHLLRACFRHIRANLLTHSEQALKC